MAYQRYNKKEREEIYMQRHVDEFYQRLENKYQTGSDAENIRLEEQELSELEKKLFEQGDDE
jgi:hypothetical protein